MRDGTRNVLLVGMVLLIALHQHVIFANQEAQPLLTRKPTVKKPPNFVIIITDDQDAIQNSTHPYYMPNLHQHIRYPGVEFKNYFVSTPVCCPSRTNLWSGKYTHNTNFTAEFPPYGGYRKWKALGIDEDYLPTWLQDLGYGTYYVGKFLVDYTVKNCKNPPAGWDDIDALVLPYVFSYFCPGFSRNGGDPQLYPDQYITDVVAVKAEAQLKTAIARGKPFLSVIAPPAPHIGGELAFDKNMNTTALLTYPPAPAPRHWRLFNDATLPDGTVAKNLYEKDVSDKPAWVRTLPLQSQQNKTFLEEVYRMRLRSLASVDELIGRVVGVLDKAGVLNNTYIIYTSDNGYHVGTHRFGAGKTTAYEEDIRVPFVIRGPGIKASKSTQPENSKVGMHVDLVPTILTLAGGDLEGKPLDGTPLGLYDNDDGTLPANYPRPQYYRNQNPLEFWGQWQDEEIAYDIYYNHTWRAVRVFDDVSNKYWKLIVACTGERELYDLKADPGELKNIYKSANSRVRSRLEGLLAVLAVCIGEPCVNPWKLIHPSGDVNNFNEALNKTYDSVYNNIQPFYFKQCLPYLDFDNEVSQFRTGYPDVSYNISNIIDERGDGFHWSLLKGRALSTRTGEYARAHRARRSTAAATAASAGAAGDIVEVFVADVEKHAVPVPQEIIESDFTPLYQNPYVLA